MRIDDYPILTDKVLEDRLENWSAWARSPKVYHRCKSLEGRYRAPQMYEDKNPKVELDIFDAAILEKVIVQLPSRNRRAIVGWHFYRCSPEKIIKDCAIHPKRFGELMRNSWSMLKNQLSLRERIDNQREIGYKGG